MNRLLTADSGVFITLEGIEGAGKSTQQELLCEWFTRRGHQCVATREPGGTSVGDALRNILLNPENVELTPIAEALLYAAARTQLVREIIRPALGEGKVVLCDRFVDSSLAYQVHGRGLPFDKVWQINQWATGGLEPDLTIFFDLPVREGLERATRRYADRMEQEAPEFHERVRAGYLELASRFAHRVKIIDAAQSKEAVHDQIAAVVESWPAPARTGDSP